VLKVRRRDDSLVTVAEADLVAGKVVPPPPPRRRSSPGATSWTPASGLRAPWVPPPGAAIARAHLDLMGPDIDW